jgi:XTP/dITP diphosphohydrolase
MKPLYFITSNKGKLHETKTELEPLGYSVIQKNIGYPEIQSEHLEDVARYGVEHLQQQLDHPFILEDAGLFIDALQGFPGVYSSYVYYTIGLDGILTLLKKSKDADRAALFKSVFAYGEPSGEMQLFIGTCQGHIAREKKGSKGFGYDPIFIPNNEQLTFAEMDTKKKNTYSHRGKSLIKLKKFLR